MTTQAPTTHSASAAVFATTRWTLVVRAGSITAPESKRALEELCRLYWYPLYAYVRRQGRSREDAEDITQGFFARFLQRNYLEGLSVEKGRFRAFLLGALKHYLANEHDRNKRLKRGGDSTILSLDWELADQRYQIEPADYSSPDRLYDRAWALALLEQVLERLREEFVVHGKPEVFEKLRSFLMLDRERAPYAEAAQALQQGEGAVRVTVHRLRRRYKELLRAEIGHTLADPAQVEEELRALFEAFR